MQSSFKLLSKETDTAKDKMKNFLLVASNSKALSKAQISKVKEDFRSDIKALRQYNSFAEDGEFEKAQNTLNGASDSLKKYVKSCKDGAPTVQGFRQHTVDMIHSLEKSTVASKAAAVGMNILKAAMNIGITLAVQALIAGIDYLIHYEEKLIEKQQELQNTYSQVHSELEQVNEELSANKKRLDELGSIKSPTYVEQQELDKLDKANQKLQTNKEYLEWMDERNRKELESGAIETFDKAYYRNWFDKASDGVKNPIESKFGKILQDYGEDEDWLEKYNEIRNSYIEQEKKGIKISESAWENLDTGIRIHKANMEDSIADMREIVSKSETALEGLEYYDDPKNSDEEAINRRFDMLYQMRAKIMTLTGDTEAAVGQILNQGQFAPVGELIAKCVDEGKDFQVVLDEISETGKLSGLHAVLKDIGLTTDDIGAYFDKSVTNGASELIDGAYEDITNLAKLTEHLSIGKDGNKAFKEEIAKLFDLDGDEFDEQFNEIFGELDESMQNAFRSMFSSDNKDNALEDFAFISEGASLLLEDIDRATKEYDEAAKELSSAFGGNVVGVEGNIDSYEELSSALASVAETQDLCKRAMEEQNTQGQLSLQTALELTSANADYATLLEVDETGAINLAKDAQQKMVGTQIDAIQKSYNQAIAMKKVELAVVKFKNMIANFPTIMKNWFSKPVAAGNALLIAFNTLLSGIKENGLKGAVAAARSAYTSAYNSYVSDLVEVIPESEDVKAIEQEIANLEKLSKSVENLTAENFYGTYTSLEDKNKDNKKSSSKSSDDPVLKAWKEKLAQKKHLLEMDKITEEEYYTWLRNNYKKELSDSKKYADEWREYEEDLYKWEQEKWDRMVAEKDHLLAMGQITEDEYYDWLIANYRNYITDREKLWEIEEKIYEREQDKAEEAKDAVEELIDYRIEMIKKEKEEEKEALQERQDNIQEFYDTQRDMLRDYYDEKDKIEERQEKRKDVTDIQAELLELSADDSAAAQKRRLELEEELAEAEKDLQKFERDEELERAEEMYDKLEEMQVEALDTQIELIDKYLDNAKALRDDAIADLQNGNELLYKEMIEYNRIYGLILWFTYKAICMINYTYMRGLPKALYQNRKMKYA